MNYVSFNDDLIKMKLNENLAYHFRYLQNGSGSKNMLNMGDWVIVIAEKKVTRNNLPGGLILLGWSLIHSKFMVL